MDGKKIKTNGHKQPPDKPEVVQHQQYLILHQTII